MGNVFASLTRRHRLPVIALALAWYRVKHAPGGESVLSMVSELFKSDSKAVRIVGDVVGVYVVVAMLRRLVVASREMRTMTGKRIKDSVGSEVIEFVKTLPVIKDKIAAEFVQVSADVEKSLKNPDREKLYSIPEEGVKGTEIISMMKDMYTAEKPKWFDGKVSGAVYHGGDEHIALQNEVFGLFNITNPLHPDIWPSVMKFEAEIVSMTANLVNGGTSTVTGTMTSGGTESIIMATKTHREWARKTRGITEPEIVAALSAHAAIDKACEMLGVKLVHVPIDPVTCMVDPKTLARYVTADTIMIYSSAPQYPHGVIDPIEELSAIAVANNCGLHVDMCLGAFVLPFAKKLGYDIPAFGFELPGVTSMSCDTHKYGYAAKGTSVVLYRTPELRHFQYFTYPGWLGGLYATPSTAGSRPGALSACTWASLVSVGEKGFLENTKLIMDGAEKIRQCVHDTEGVYVMGDSKAMIVAFASDAFSVYALADEMEHKGWALNSLQRPASVHVCVTLPITKSIDLFCTDFTDSVAKCLANPKSDSDDGQGRVYGMASAMPAGPVQDILKTYTDVVLKV